MKLQLKNTAFLIVAVAFLLWLCTSFTMFTMESAWTKCSSISEPGRYYTFSFALNGQGFVAGGGQVSKHIDNITRYDPVTDKWYEEEPFPGGTIYSPAGFVINDTVYMVGGHNGNAVSDKVWAYCSADKKWKQAGKLPGKPVYDACGFAIGNKGYLFGGSMGGPPYSNALWEFSAITHEWNKRVPLPSTGRSCARVFVLNDEAYVIGGLLYGALESTTNEVWKYNPKENKWKRMGNFPGGSRMGGETFVVKGEGYYCGGFSTKQEYNDLWRYNPATEVWTSEESYPGKAHWGAFVFTISDTAYIGGGITSDELAVEKSDERRCFRDFWRFIPGATKD